MNKDEMPREIVDRLTAIEAQLKSLDDDTAQLQQGITKLGVERLRLKAEHAAIIETAAVYQRMGDRKSNPPPVSPGVIIQRPRQRRSIRNEVLSYIRASTANGLRPTRDQIAKAIDAPVDGVEKALAFHEREGIVVEQESTGAWRLADRHLAEPPASTTEAEPLSDDNSNGNGEVSSRGGDDAEGSAGSA